MLSPMVKKALRGLAARTDAAEPDEPAPVARTPGSPVLRPLEEGPGAPAASPVLRPLPTESPAPSPTLRPLPMDDEPAPTTRAASGVLRPLPMDEPEPPTHTLTSILRPLRRDEPARFVPPVPEDPEESPVLRPMARERAAFRPGSAPIVRPLASEPSREDDHEMMAGARSSAPRDEAPGRDAPEDDAEPPSFASARPAHPTRVDLSVGKTFVATLLVALCSQLASALLAAGAGAGAVYVVATALSSGVAEVMAILVFTMVMVVWMPAVVQLASRSAWRTALKEHGIARGVAEGIASSLVPRRWSDGSVAGDPAGLGLYGLRDRVRLALEQGLSDSLRIRWARRCVSGAAAAKTDEAMQKFLGPVEGFGKLDRESVRTALADAIESALVGKGMRAKQVEESA